MGRVRTAKYKHNTGYKATYAVSVDSAGVFSTTLESHDVDMLEKAGVKTNPNRLGRNGHFSAETLNGLMDVVAAAFGEALSEELIEEKIVLKYVIETACSYCVSKAGDIVPNGTKEWTGYDSGEGNGWRQGTRHTNAADRAPYGINVYVQPFVRESYRYRSGETREKYVYMSHSEFGMKALEEDRCLRWLYDIVSICQPSRSTEMYIEYNPDVGKFFVDMVTAICRLAGRINDFVTPVAITEFVASGRLLTEGG